MSCQGLWEIGVAIGAIKPILPADRGECEICEEDADRYKFGELLICDDCRQRLKPKPPKGRLFREGSIKDVKQYYGDKRYNG
jgi:hypothetical protein